MRSSRTVGRRSDSNQTMLLSRRLCGWRGASFSKFNWNSCTALSSRILGLAAGSDTGGGTVFDSSEEFPSARCPRRTLPKLLRVVHIHVFGSCTDSPGWDQLGFPSSRTVVRPILYRMLEHRLLVL